MNKLTVINLLLVSSSTMAFTAMPKTKTVSQFLVQSTTQAESTPFFLDEVETNKEIVNNTPKLEKNEIEAQAPILLPIETEQESPKAAAPVVKPKKVTVKKPNHKEGVFSPIVIASKKIVGDDNINKLRAKFISLHSGVIGDFVQTHESPLGNQIAKSLFVVMDANNDGTLDKEELKTAFETLGFTWLQEKQVNGILKRADKDNNGVIDYDEFKAELNKTLKTNLIKLAKKNGEEMGLLV